MSINSGNISVLAISFLGYRIAFSVTQIPLLAANNTRLNEQSQIALHNYEIQILKLAEKTSTFLHSSVSNLVFFPLCVGV